MRKGELGMDAPSWALDRKAEQEPQAADPWYRSVAAAQQGRAFLWAPVAMVLGIWLYFGLRTEPSIMLASVAAAGSAALFWLGRSAPAAAVAACLLAGFCAAKARTDWNATPILRAPTASVEIAGQVMAIERRSPRRAAMTIAVTRIEGIAGQDQPRFLRLTLSASQGTAAPGDTVVVKARLSPLPFPVGPGEFDYGRQLYLSGIGGTGRVVEAIRVTSGEPVLIERAHRTIGAIRHAIGERIRAALAPPHAAFAEALVTGERSDIPADVNRSLQISGLAHILSISGLHMSLVAGGVFWLVRALLAAVPALALRHPIKKWAAAAALAIGFFYLLLAGADVATRRSYIMIAIVFLAVIFDRPAFSLRNLALAALIILVAEPETAISASFQMSFMAVIGLAAFHEAWTDRRRRLGVEYRLEGRMKKFGRAAAAVLAGSIMTTLVAGSMSSIPAAYHFGRVAPYGVLANGLALPLVSLAVMPMALAGVLFMPFDLEAWPLAVMGEGLAGVLAISDWVAHLPGAAAMMPRLPVHAVGLMAAGAVVLCLVRGLARLAGPAILLVGLLSAGLSHPPDILIDGKAANVAVRGEDGRLVPADPRKSRFAVARWLQAAGDDMTVSKAARRAGWTCEGRRCTATVKGRGIVFLRDGSGPPPSCAGADIVIAAFPLKGRCGSALLRVDRFDVWRRGAHAVWLDDAPVLGTARDARGERPWNHVPAPRRK